MIFFKTLVLSSILILSLFFITFVTGIDILPISTANRGFVNVERVFIASEGIMILLIPMGAVLIVFKNKMKWRGLFLLSSFMMFLNYILSITRRDIIGTFIFFFITMILYNYFNHKSLIPVKKLLSVSFYIIIFGFFISISFPKYLEAGVAGLEESANVVKYGESTSGKKDVRMGFGKEFMQNLIIENKWFGTGYDKRWTGGDKLGYETRDYPFLAAIAMTGIFGILIFLPIYIVLVKAMVSDILFLRKHKINYQCMEFYIIIIFIVYFILDLMQYMNWFLPVSLIRSPKWYMFFAMYLASRQIFYNKFRMELKRQI